MSRSIWFEQVNKGLIAEILNTVKVMDSSGALVSLPEKSVTVRKPEDEFKVEMFPCVSIYNRSTKFDPVRYSAEPIMTSRSVDKPVATFKKPAVPFIMYYQVDFWAKYQTDIDTMTESWLMEHFKQFNLSVKDMGGYDRTCNCVVKGAAVPSNLMMGGERMYHTTVRVDIWVELDSEMSYNEFIVTNRIIKSMEKGD